jgi:NAD(P)H-nitrite reductase large subunit
MLKDGEKGVIRQKGKDVVSYAIAPHLPCGIIVPDQLRAIADVAEKYDIAALKITSAARIAMVGVKEEDVDGVWKDLGMNPGHAIGICVRSIKACPGTTFCRVGKQDSLKLGMELDSIYHGMDLPGKMKMGVSGCQLQCAENCIKDISLYGTKVGWTVQIGGNGSTRPRLADVLVEDVPDSDALSIVDKIVNYYKENAKKERMGKMVDRIGLEKIKSDLGIN